MIRACRSIAYIASGAVLIATLGCSSSPCCAPLPARPPAEAAPTPSLPDFVRQAALDAALKTWTDEITEGTKWLAGCLYEADREPDPLDRERRREQCLEPYEARMKANEERYARVEAAIGK